MTDQQQYDGPWPRKGKRPDPRRKMFPDALREHNGNVSKAAEALGISRKSATRWVRLLREGKLFAFAAVLALAGCNAAPGLGRNPSMRDADTGALLSDTAGVRRELEAFSRRAHYEYDSPEVEALAALHVGAALDRLTAAIREAGR